LESKHKEHATESIEFFKNKEQELRQSRKQIKKIATGSCNENAMKASYEVSMFIAKAGKPHTVAEELILPAAKAMVSAMVGEKAVKDLNLLELSNNMVKKRVDKITDNMKEQFIEGICKSQNYSLQVDKSTDFANKSHLLRYVRYEFEGKIIDDLLFCSSLIHTNAEEVFNSLNEFLTLSGIQWPKYVGISTDGARAVTGRLTGLIARIREINPSVTWHHSCIHRESLVTKKMPVELKKVLNESIKIVNFIKARSLNSRLF
jgi:predicted CoA-binding protein